LINSNPHTNDSFQLDIYSNNILYLIGIDLEDTIVLWNKGAKNIFGYSQKEVIGKNFDILLTPEAKNSGELKWINAQLKQEGFIKNFEVERATKEGKCDLFVLKQSRLYFPYLRTISTN